LQALRHDPQCYGILRPRSDARLTIKSVTTDAALLFLTLQNGARLPQSVIDALGDRCDSFIGKMVLDEILQVDVDGVMLCGPAAIGIIDSESRSQPERFIATLSRRALEYAEVLDISSALELSDRLYSYNRAAASALWRRTLRDRLAVESYLGIGGARLEAMLDASWIRLPEHSTTGWIAWRSKRAVANPISPSYKLYISPTCEVVGAVLGSVVEAASRFGTSRWKIGSDIYGLLRPDKLILYFESFTSLREAAAYLLEHLEGCPSQGVPFTAELEARGLLSWGIDPPPEDTSVPWLNRQSWRSRICNILASALLLAKSAPSNRVSASRFAALRLRLEGIDTDSWTPAT
jgi:hypothetical protein